MRVNTRHKLRGLPGIVPATLALLVLFTLAWSAADASRAAAAVGSSGAHSELAALAEEKAAVLVDTFKATSVQCAVISQGQIILSGNAGVYSRTEDKPITADTMYGIGSASKMFATVVVMLLVDRGLVDLTLLTTYIPEFFMADTRYTQITPRMLLNHSSGLMGLTFNNVAFFHDIDPIGRHQLIADLAHQRLKADPGEFSVYCNDGFALAELLVERVSGESFTDFVKASFTDPLGMTNTATPESNFDRSRLARTYVDVAGGTEVIDALSGVIGSGGIYSTAEDLCKFAGIFMDDPGYAPARGVLSTESRAAMAAYEFEKGIWPEPGATICALMTLRPRSYRRADPAPGTRSSQPSCCSMC